METKPNILYIMTDQQSAHMMSCAGTEWVNTPNIDRIAQTGIRFTRAYCGNPVCIPSRFSLFTGYLPEKIGLRSNPFDHLQPCTKEILEKGMGHLFNNAGYKSVYGGKQHFPGYSAEDIGFEVITENERDELVDFSCDFLSQKHNEPWLLVASFINPHDICYKGICDYFRHKGMMPENLKDSVEYKTLKKYDLIPEGIRKSYFAQMYCPPIPKNYKPQKDEPSIIEDFIDQRSFKRYIAENYDLNDWRIHRYIYKKLTEEMDKQVGKILDALKESDYAKNTVIVFTSDHGDMDGSHRLEHKTVLYEEAIRIPLIIAHPQYEKGTSSDMLCSNALDLLPTLLGVCGIEIPAHLKGVNLIDAHSGKTASRSYVPIESELGRCIVGKDYKYVKYDYGENCEQLYDYANDPEELNNHIGEASNKEVFNSLKDIFEKTWSKEQREKNPTPLLKGKLKF
jgi:arylsulfatase A-like enzyme